MNTAHVRRETAELDWKTVHDELIKRGASVQHYGILVERGDLFRKVCYGLPDLQNALADLRCLDAAGIKPVGGTT